MRRGLMTAGFWVCLGTGGLAAWAAAGLWIPAQPGGPSRVFQVHSGETLHSVAHKLETEHLLPERALFGPRLLVLFARFTGVDREIKSGEYDLDPSMTPLHILEKLVSGSVKTYAVTLPEGLRMDEIAARFESASIVKASLLIARARDPVFVQTLGFDTDTLEGYLYPETYRFRRDTPPEEVLQRMVEVFRERWSEADHALLKSSGMDLGQVLTLASIVEKETAVGSERPQIAAVFLNRLRRRMRLQSDPTVIYGILHTRGSFDGNLRWRDLRTDTPYNTYTRGGLPPGPIASPSMEAIRAVLEPEDVPYLYFVSRNDGTHKFSRTLKEHNRAVDQFQRKRRPRKSS